MSKFDSAMKKAGAAAPKPKAKAGTAVKPKAAPKKPVFKTLDEKKKWARAHEHKIEDAENDATNEPNKAEKKLLETKLKNLKSDAIFLEVLEEIKDQEIQAKKDAERASISAGSKAAEDAKKDAKEAASSGSVAAICLDLDSVLAIDVALQAKGKEAAAEKANAVKQLEQCAACTAFVLPRLHQLVELFGDSKLGGPSQKAAKAIVEQASPAGHGAVAAMPILVAGMSSRTWKIKAACIDLLRPCLHSMNAGTPAQLSHALPEIVTKLAEAALEVRAEVRASCKNVLSLIGGMVSSPEISKHSQDLVAALSEPTNQKRTQEVLAKMGNQTFMSLIDAASLALLMPIVVRGLRSQEAQSKKWSAQIFGSISMLVKDVEMMQPYLKTILPLLQELLTDPVAEVQREAAKAFGIVEQVLPDFSWKVTTPWLFQKMGNGNHGEQIGASLALAEVLTKMEKARKIRCDALIPEIQAGALHEKWNFKRGYLELLDAAPQAMKMAFAPYIGALFPACLMGITGDKDPVEDPAYRAATALVARFGDLCPELLLPAMEGVYLSTLGAASPQEEARFTIVREKTATLIAKTAEKILEHKKFGQDLLTTEESSTRETREYLLGLVFALRSDPEAGVKRVANGCYKSAGGAPKVQKAMAASLEKMMSKWRSGECGAAAQRVAKEVLGVLAESGDCEAPSDDMPEAKVFRFPELQAKVAGVNGEDAAAIAKGSAPPSLMGLSIDGSSGQGRARTASAAQDFLESESRFNTLPADVKHHCSHVARSVTIEAQNKKMGGKKLTADLLEELKSALEPVRSCFTPFDDELPLVCEAVARAALGEGFDAAGDGDDDSDEVLLHVENLLLMYGAGHLLLRDTTLDMKKNHRYGVVGENGAGKTTLMKEIATHRIVNMPQDLKCIHVDDSKLGLMSKSALSCTEYAMKMGNDIGVTTASDETLKEVGFSAQMCKDPVSELSTGWRMRLTLGVNMLKHADLVLLDEPTNHLDEESVEWLADYIISIHESSVMVISHEPKFLNKICTHVVAYVDKKLEYSAGNFDAFAASKGLSMDQIHSMLSGNLSFNTKTQEELEAEERGEVVAKVAAPIAGPPKLSFPIAGSMDGVKSASKSVMELKNLSFRYGADKEYLVDGCSGKLSLNSRVAICGRNGCGKSTLMTLLCSEMGPSEGSDGAYGEVWRHQNLRLGYLKQDHLKALGPFFDTSPFVYITSRFKDGYDGDLQKRLIEPEDDEDAARRAKLAKQYGKYGNPVGDLVSRSTTGKTLMYEVAWEGLDDPKQNTMEPIGKLKQMGLDKVIIACDERIAAKAAGLDQRPLTRREVVKHCEAFGIDEEMCCNRQVRGFSAGQKVRLSLAAMFWTKPHLIAVDEPTNYLDVETVEALAKALTNFRGGIVMIEPKTEFVERICNERWNMEGGIVTVEKMNNKNKRQA